MSDIFVAIGILATVLLLILGIGFSIFYIYDEITISRSKQRCKIRDINYDIECQNRRELIELRGKIDRELARLE